MIEEITFVIRTHEKNLSRPVLTSILVLALVWVWSKKSSEESHRAISHPILNPHSYFFTIIEASVSVPLNLGSVDPQGVHGGMLGLEGPTN